MPSDFTPDEEDKLYSEFAEQDQRLNSSRVQASAQLAQTVGNFYRMNPDMNPGVILAASKAYQSGAMSLEQYQKLSMDLLRREADVALSSEPSDKNKSWWERNVAGPVTQKIRTASRWTFAGLNFVPQFVQGGIGQIFDDNDSVAGWFISTDLGTLIENDEVAGEGFFIGGRAAELQAERARRYRGEIDGKAFTIGRGVATLVTQPGSTQYSIVSGLLDAGAAIATPTAPGAKVISRAGAAASASTGLTRSLAGLADFETGVIRRSKVKEWLDSSAGSRVIDRIAKIETIDEAIRIFPKVQDTNFWIQATDLKTAGEVRTFLDETLGLTGPSRVSDINIGRASDVVNNKIGERFSYIRRMMAKVPGQHLVLQIENQRDAVASVNSLNNYLKLIQRFGDKAVFDDTKRIELVDRFTRAINNAEGDVYQVVEEFDSLLRQTLLAQGVPEEAIADLTKGLKQFKDNPVYGYINDIGDPDNMGAKFVNPLGTETVLEQPPIVGGTTIKTLDETAEVPKNMLKGNTGQTIETGKSVTVNVYRGSGSTVRQGQGEQAIFGPAFYGTPNYDEAAYFAGREVTGFDPATNKPIYSDVPGKIEKFEITLSNPLVVVADDVSKNPGDIGWRELTKMAGLKYAKFGISEEPDAPQKLRQLVEQMGHDGIVIRLTDKFGNQYYGTAISDMMRAEQIIAFNPTQIDAQTLAKQTNVEMFDGPMATAVLESEELNNPLMLPDPRRVRRMMSEVGWIYGKGDRLSDPSKYRELRMPFAAMEFFQNEVWRPIVLATGGYALRNMSDSAIRQSLAPGLRTGIYHPLEWIQVALYKKFRGDLEGNPFKGTPEELLQSGQDEFAQAVSQGLRERMDPVTLERRGLRKNVWKRVRRSDGTAYRKGLQDEVSLLSEDRAAALVAGGQTNDEIIELMKTDPNMKQYVRRLQNRWRNRTVTDVDGNKAVKTVEFVRADGTLNEANLNEFLNKYVRERINRVTGNDQRLISIIASEGSAITLADGTTISPFVTGAGGRRIGYSDSFNTAADEIIADGNIKLKDTYKTKVEVDAAVDARYRGKQRNKVFEGMDRTVDLLFGSLYPKREAFLNRSPAFRQFYYNQIDNLLDELAPGEAKKIIDNLREAAKDAGAKYTDKWAARYLGDGDLYQRIAAKAKGEIPSNGKLSLNEVSAYAKGYALDETQKLFYNVAQNSNFADIFRVVSPFGSAWADVISTWTRLATQNPDNLKRLGVSVKGLRDADPDNDGKGFFWRDPTTGEYVFNYPYSEKIGPLASYLGGMGALTGGVFGGKKGALVGGAVGLVGGLAGEKALGMEGLTLTAPARSLNMGLNIVPGVGPFVQIGANRILGNIPQADDVRKILAPYGEPQLTLLPSWAQKVVAALDDPDNNRLLGDMMIDTMRVLSMTGKYDLSNPADVEELENDALGRARGLLLLRALGQFTGPTRPDIEFKTETFQGDMYMAELSKAFRDMQSQNYDTAVERFLLTFGEDAFLYVSGKTKSEAGGLEATTAFGNFERNNTSLFNRYRDVAGYFAPVGSNFDYQVYLRQLESGDRTRIKPTELVEEAQSLVGRSLYRSVVRQIGPNPNDSQKDYLKQMRTILEDRFPGYATTPIDINRLPAQLVLLEQAAFDPILADNEIAQAARLYFDARNRALAEAQNRGFTTLGGKQVADLRGWLRDIGESLAKQIPEFERLYDRVLFNEIDIDAGEI